ncbi:MAG: hypothetical protein KBA31_17990 [Alphaproteobacteria bacterium]|nr:hypothetical protein [Alphaproteobacteria bacterium]
MRRLAAAALLLLCASGARAEATRPVCFIGQVFLAGVADNACVSGAKERKRLLDTEVVDWKRKPAPLVMRGDKPKDKITVTTCRRWLRAISLSRVAMRAEDREREAFYQRTCQTLDQLKFALPARKVFLTSNGRDLLRPALVPARLLEQAGIKGPLALPGVTVAELSKAGELVIRDRKTGLMEVTWRNADLTLNAAARGDFDGDGIEDLAVAMEVVLRGSKRSGTMIVFVTRKKIRGPLEVIYPKARG